MPHAYTEDHVAVCHTLTRPIPAGEEVEQPAIGLLAELGWQVALPHPHPCLSQRERRREKGGRQAGSRVRSLTHA